MIIKLTEVVVIIIIFRTAIMKNPIKICTTLGIFTLIIIVKIFTVDNTTWFPIIITIIMTGGVIIAAMLVVSVIPNEPNNPLTLPKIIITLIILLVIITQRRKIYMSECSFKQIKNFLRNNITIASIIVLITLYFYTFMVLTEKYNNSLRTEWTC